MLNRILVAVVLVGVAFGARASYVTEAVAQMPAKNSADEAVVSAKVMAGGAPAVKELCGLLTPLGAAEGKDDSGARYLMTALVRHAGRTGGEADRAALEQGLCQALAADGVDAEVKSFLALRLQDVGGDASVPALAPLLADDKLALYAAPALERIATPAAADALNKALPGAASGPRRVALLKSLGMLRTAAAAGEMKKSATDDDKTVRMTALWALASVGDPAAHELIAAALKDAKSEYDRSRLYAWDVLLVRRMADAGAKDAAVARATEMMGDGSSASTAAAPAYARIAAARTLAEIQGEAAAPALLVAADHGDPAFRAAAVDAVMKIPGEKVTAAVVARLAAAATPDAKADLLDALGRRRDPSAQDAVLNALKDADAAVRAAAVRTTAAAVPPAQAVPALLERVNADPSDEVARAAADAVGRMPGDAPLAAVAQALGSAPAKAKVTLLDVLAARATPAHAAAVMKQTAPDADSGVRSAALRAMEKLATATDVAPLIALAVAAKDASPDETAALKAAVAGAAQVADPEARGDAFVAAIKSAQGPKRAAIEKAVAKLGGKAALDAVVADLKGDDKAVREGGLRALAEWKDEAALPSLLDAARAEGAPLTQQVIALRGAAQVLKTSKMPAAEKVKAYATAMAAAKRPEEKKMVLGALGGERGQEAFDLAAASLDDDALKAEAAIAVIKIALPPGRGQAGLTGAPVAETLKRAAAACPDKALKADATRYAGTIK